MVWNELEDMLGASQVFEAARAKISQLGPSRQAADLIMSLAREQDLAAATGRQQRNGVVKRWADIGRAVATSRAGVQRHMHMRRGSLAPGLNMHRPVRSQGGGKRGLGGWESRVDRTIAVFEDRAATGMDRLVE